MRPPEISLRTTYSNGPHNAGFDPIPRGTACAGCRTIPRVDAVITKVNGSWWHGSCASRWLREVGTDEAWLLLAARLADAPTHFDAAETKAITQNLLRIAGRSVSVPDGPEPAYDEPPKPLPRPDPWATPDPQPF
ncbi:hypothetical protein ACFRCG_42670 [Embleya sp. NPDC056575]|uniref:hypothetical protein n=1 Tax=unclassified Embleya TaxID=2699296 RepID=UPI003680E408